MTAEPARPLLPPTRGHDRRIAEPLPTGWQGWAARLGYVAKGVVYVVMGALGLGVAVGVGEEAAGSREAIERVAALPFGRILAALLGVGLVGYATLSIVSAARDPEGHGRDLGGVVTRVVDAFTGVVYLGLAGIALGLVAAPAALGAAWVRHWLRLSFEAPAVQLVVGATGLGLIASGVWLVYKAAALADQFGARLDRRELGEASRRWVVRLARAGTVARGAAFGFAGLLLTGAALRGETSTVH
ncbi:MAG TPA: DUF1206 domain-containing protein, partial [Gemmatimonadaceae bacterium]|nr:DUF1206 domain-containing protein [Gemmatimonadaceae bacterium]